MFAFDDSRALGGGAREAALHGKVSMRRAVLSLSRLDPRNAAAQMIVVSLDLGRMPKLYGGGGAYTASSRGKLPQLGDIDGMAGKERRRNMSV